MSGLSFKQYFGFGFGFSSSDRVRALQSFGIAHSGLAQFIDILAQISVVVAFDFLQIQEPNSNMFLSESANSNNGAVPGEQSLHDQNCCYVRLLQLDMS